MSNVLSIAVSGMTAATRRLEVSARNVANVRSTGALPADAPPEVQRAFEALRLDQTEAPGGGAATTVSTVSPPVVPVYDPSAPFADENGMVAAPNVDLENEVVQQMIARYAFAANVGVARADAAMKKALLDIKA